MGILIPKKINHDSKYATNHQGILTFGKYGWNRFVKSKQKLWDMSFSLFPTLISQLFGGKNCDLRTPEIHCPRLPLTPCEEVWLDPKNSRAICPSDSKCCYKITMQEMIAHKNLTSRSNVLKNYLPRHGLQKNWVSSSNIHAADQYGRFRFLPTPVVSIGLDATASFKHVFLTIELVIRQHASIMFCRYNPNTEPQRVVSPLSRWNNPTY